MPVEKKRPRGLKGSAAAKANKKTKTEEQPTSTTELPENSQTVVIDKVVEEGDEVGEAAALFESALEKLGKYSRKCLISPVLIRACIRNRPYCCFTSTSRYHP